MTLFPRIPHWCKPSISDLIKTLPKNGKFLYKYTNMCNLEVLLCKSSQQKTLKQVLRKSWFWVEDLLPGYISHPIPLSFLGSPRARFLHWWYQPITSQPCYPETQLLEFHNFNEYYSSETDNSHFLLRQEIQSCSEVSQNRSKSAEVSLFCMHSLMLLGELLNCAYFSYTPWSRNSSK